LTSDKKGTIKDEEDIFFFLGGGGLAKLLQITKNANTYLMKTEFFLIIIFIINDYTNEIIIAVLLN
jgi:hypothetical protein